MLLSPRLRRTEGAPHKERETETTGVPSFSLSHSHWLWLLQNCVVDRAGEECGDGGLGRLCCYRGLSLPMFSKRGT